MPHTPGPWHVAGDFVDGPIDGNRSDDGFYRHSVALVFGPDGPANARLIAAAPELLALLVELKASHYGAAVREDYETRVEAAITKAEGT